jgi:hypothetical protein
VFLFDDQRESSTTRKSASSGRHGHPWQGARVRSCNCRWRSITPSAA